MSDHYHDYLGCEDFFFYSSFVQLGTGGELICEMVPNRLKERDLESLPNWEFRYWPQRVTSGLWGGCGEKSQRVKELNSCGEEHICLSNVWEIKALTYYSWTPNRTLSIVNIWNLHDWLIFFFFSFLADLDKHSVERHLRWEGNLRCLQRPCWWLYLVYMGVAVRVAKWGLLACSDTIQQQLRILFISCQQSLWMW